MLATALVDTSALWKIVVASFVGGAGVVIAFGFVLLGSTRFAEARHEGVAAKGAYALLAFVGGSFCVAALVLGFWAMTKK